MYSLNDYVWMIADQTRVAAYAGALRAAVRPGARVLEVGAGFGFFSVLAARAGAGHVDAVETNPAIHLGPKLAAANDCADRIAFHHLDVAQLQLDGPADVLLIDVRGPTPFGRRSLELVIRARDRFLRPGGTIIAARDRVFVAPVRAPAVFRREVHAAHGRQDVNLDPIERVVFDTPIRCTIERTDLVCAGQQWTEIDYATVARTDGAGTAEWALTGPETIDGLAVWFETNLGGEFGFSTAPGEAVQAYRQMFIPFRNTIHVSARTRLRVHLSARQVRENYLWEWQGWLHSKDVPDGRLVVRQNSLAEIVLDPATLPETAPDARPCLGPRGRAVLALLNRMDGDHTLSALSASLADESPDLFPDAAAAAEFVAGWVRQAGRIERGTE